MIDIKFSKNFDQELDKLFENLDQDKKGQNITQNYISPYCYDLKTLTSNNESLIPIPAPLNTEPQSSPRSK